jgi:hypothetical protein
LKMHNYFLPSVNSCFSRNSLISNGKPIPKKRLKYFIDDLEDLYENNHKAKYDIDIKRHLLILEYD